jgi:hypothetical protein
MLIYHPIHDINHCIYRLLRFLEKSNHVQFQWDQVRLIDFYSIFPHLLKNIRPFPKELSAYKKILSIIPDTYESIPNDKRVFYELMPIQNTALHNLIAKNLVDSEEFKMGVVSRTEEPIPEKLKDKIREDSIAQEEWFMFLVNELPTVEFDGKKGLKFRSDLMEYRYDG